MDVRIVYRDQNNATGNLEICYEHTWMPVCSEQFSSSDLQVTCRAMGYPGDEDIFQRGVSYLNVSWQHFPAKLNCNGSERNLSGCPTSLTSVSQCSSVRIQCSGKYLLIRLFINIQYVFIHKNSVKINYNLCVQDVLHKFYFCMYLLQHFQSFILFQGLVAMVIW